MAKSTRPGLRRKFHAGRPVSHHHHSHSDAPPLASQIEFPESGWIRAVNQGERFLSEGWRFADWHQFDRMSLRRLLFVTEAERIKGIFITNEGVFAYNAVAGEVKEYRLTRRKRVGSS